MLRNISIILTFIILIIIFYGERANIGYHKDIFNKNISEINKILDNKNYILSIELIKSFKNDE